MVSSPEIVVEAIGPCTEDVRDCEIMRAAITLMDSGPDNDRAHELRTELAKSACRNCTTAYLGDIA